MKKIFVIGILLLLATATFGQDDQKIATNSLIFKSFEQKNGFSRTGVSFNYFASTLGFSFDFFINGILSVDVAFDGVYSFQDYYSGQSIGAKLWLKKIQSTNKLYPFVGLGYSEIKSSKFLIKSGSYYDVPVGVRYFFTSGLQITYSYNLRNAFTNNMFLNKISNFTFGVGWRF
jgi:hypothetical protein